MSANHTIHSLKHHFGWDNSNVPIINAISGETIEIDTVDSSGSQLNINSAVDDVKNLDFSKDNPVTGPIFVEDAKEGDVVEVYADCSKINKELKWTTEKTLENCMVDSWGWENNGN